MRRLRDGEHCVHNSSENPLTPAQRPCMGGLLNKRNRVFGGALKSSRQCSSQNGVQAQTAECENVGAESEPTSTGGRSTPSSLSRRPPFRRLDPRLIGFGHSLAGKPIGGPTGVAERPVGTRWVGKTLRPGMIGAGLANRGWPGRGRAFSQSLLTAPGGIRTRYLQFRKPALYPNELRKPTFATIPKPRGSDTHAHAVVRQTCGDSSLPAPKDGLDDRFADTILDACGAHRDWRMSLSARDGIDDGVVESGGRLGE